MTKARTIVVAGGGSGGHVYPVLEIIRQLHELDPALLFVYIGQRGGSESEIVASASLPVKIVFHGITAEKLRRYWDIRTLKLPWAILTGTWQALRILEQARPVSVLCKGGYVGVPVAIAAWILRIPIVLHETDAIMGLANRMIAPFASRIAVSFPRHNLTRTRQTKGKLVYTGHPLSPSFFTRYERTTERPHLVITGGSQGAGPINTLIAAIAPALVERYEVTHLTGKQDYGRMKAAISDRHYHPIAYTNEMAGMLGQADLVVSRAGGTLFELAALGKPTILIPIPGAANNHQRVNADILAGNNAAVVLDEATLTPSGLLNTITSLMQDSALRAQLGRSIRQFARSDAAAQVARLTLEVTRS